MSLFSPRTTTALAAVALAAALATPAWGAPPWTEPQSIGTPSPEIAGPRLGFDVDGRSLVTWTAQPSPGSSRLVPRGADGSVGAERQVAGDLFTRPLLLSARRFLLLTARSPMNGPETLWAAAARASGHVGPARRLARAKYVGLRTGDANGRGVAAVAWAEHRDVDEVLLRARVLRAGRWSATITLAEVSDVVGLDVFVGDKGELLVVGAVKRARRRAVEAYERTPGGRLKRPVRVGTHDGRASIAAALTRAGRVLVVWQTQDGGIETSRPPVVFATTRAPGARGFARVQQLDAGDLAEAAPGRVALAVAPDGGAVAGWSSARRVEGRVTFPVRTARAGRNGRFGRPTTLDRSGQLGDVVVSIQGAYLATWATIPSGYVPVAVRAAVRPSGASSFGAPEAVSGDEGAGLPDAAFDPRTSRPVVAWAGRPGAGGPPQQAVVRLAGRSG